METAKSSRTVQSILANCGREYKENHPSLWTWAVFDGDGRTQIIQGVRVRWEWFRKEEEWKTERLLRGREHDFIA